MNTKKTNINVCISNYPSTSINVYMEKDFLYIYGLYYWWSRERLEPACGVAHLLWWVGVNYW